MENVTSSSQEIKLKLVPLLRAVEWSSYMLKIGGRSVYVTVTEDPDMVRYWISTVLSLSYEIETKLVVGVLFQWTLNSANHHRVSVLQLCLHQSCLIFQIGRAVEIPCELKLFLNDEKIAYVGIGIRRYAVILDRDYGICIGPGIVDLKELYEIRRRGSPMWGIYEPLRMLIIWVLKSDYKKPLSFYTSNWDELQLEEEQIKYASADAYCTYWIGVLLQAWKC